MFKNEIPLPVVITSKDYIITRIDNDVKHLFKFGFSNGVKIKKIFSNPFNDPSAYEIMSTVIALRNQDAEKIFVIPSESNK